MIKNWLMFAALFLALQFNAQAMILDDDTGHHSDIIKPKVIDAAQDLETSFYEYFPVGFGQPSNSSYKDGLGQSTYIGNGGGVAYEFNLANETDITSILDPVAVSRGLNGNTPVLGTTPVTLSLFSGSSNKELGITFPNGEVIPNINNRILTENFTAVGTNLTQLMGNPQGQNDNANYSYEGINDLNLDLAPGNYWVGLEGGDSFTFFKPNISLAVTPEPSTWYFFGLIILIIFFRGYYLRKSLV